MATIAGAMIPLGAILARVEHVQDRWLEAELRHFVIAFGGGVLLAAVALVLVPVGAETLSMPLAMLTFGGGGVLFAVFDALLAKRQGGMGQTVAMLADFLPEALALGAMFAAGERAAPLPYPKRPVM
jgi:ZIP family zinc transporter